ncbi:hypothetical protein ACWGS9_27910 [Bradyrhizobium sp. Arg314]
MTRLNVCRSLRESALAPGIVPLSFAGPLHHVDPAEPCELQGETERRSVHVRESERMRPRGKRQTSDMI